jgi:hypothetical protein
MVNTAPRRQLGLIAIGYAAIAAVAAALLYQRHLQELRNPLEASGGMWAAGDALLDLFIAGLFTIPTIALLWIIRTCESSYTIYSRILLCLSLSAPLWLGILWLGNNRLWDGMITICWYRLLWSPVLLAGMGVSRLFARFERAKRLSSCALLVEGINAAITIALVISSAAGANGR